MSVSDSWPVIKLLCKELDFVLNEIRFRRMKVGVEYEITLAL